jgi:hypothetical protein
MSVDLNRNSGCVLAAEELNFVVSSAPSKTVAMEEYGLGQLSVRAAKRVASELLEAAAAVDTSQRQRPNNPGTCFLFQPFNALDSEVAACMVERHVRILVTDTKRFSSCTVLSVTGSELRRFKDRHEQRKRTWNLVDKALATQRHWGLFEFFLDERQKRNRENNPASLLKASYDRKTLVVILDEYHARGPGWETLAEELSTRHGLSVFVTSPREILLALEPNLGPVDGSFDTINSIQVTGMSSPSTPSRRPSGSFQRPNPAIGGGKGGLTVLHRVPLWRGGHVELAPMAASLMGGAHRQYYVIYEHDEYLDTYKLQNREGLVTGPFTLEELLQRDIRSAGYYQKVSYSYSVRFYSYSLV